MKLSLSGFLFEDHYTSQSLDFSRFCALARSAGYVGVELRDTQLNPDSSEQRKQEISVLLKQEGLFVTCLTARKLAPSGPARDSGLHRYFELCRQLDCHLVKVNGEPSWLREMIDPAEQYGVMLASNNHINSPLETLAGTRHFFAGIGEKRFGLLYDSMHLYLGDQDYISCISEFYPKICNVLIHSMRPVLPGEKPALKYREKTWINALPDEAGVQNYPGIFRVFKKMKYNGLFTVIESGWPVDRREYVARHCAETLRNLWIRPQPSE